MYVYFTDKKVHRCLYDVDDAIYAFLSKYDCAAYKKQIYLADDGHYELSENTIFKHTMEFIQPPLINPTSYTLSVSTMRTNKTKVNVMPTNVVKVDIIVEMFKITEAMKFIVERNDDATIDYYFEIKGNVIDEPAIISFLSGISNVCLN